MLVDIQNKAIAYKSTTTEQAIIYLVAQGADSAGRGGEVVGRVGHLAHLVHLLAHRVAGQLQHRAVDLKNVVENKLSHNRNRDSCTNWY